MKQIGKREKIEKWMGKADIEILGIQETHISKNTKEKRKRYTWFFNGNDRIER